MENHYKETTENFIKIHFGREITERIQDKEQLIDN